MAITADKTWQFDLDNYVPADTTTNAGLAFFDKRSLLLGIKDALTGFSSMPWTVTSSSDSSTTAASDLWVDEDDLVWRDDDTSNVFSWIILRQTGISTTFELLLTCEEDNTSSDGAQIGAWTAQAGFTGGTTTARPTATDERIIRDSTADGYWGSGNAASYDFMFHVWQSDDGECTRVVIFINGIDTGFWLFDKPNNPVSGWTNPYIAVISGDNSVTISQCTYAKFYDAANVRGCFNTNPVTSYFSGEGFGSAAVGELMTVPNDFDDTFGAGGMGLQSLSATFTGRMGDVYDLLWGFSVIGTGRYYPVAGTKLFVQIKDMIFPWDGATIIQTK